MPHITITFDGTPKKIKTVLDVVSAVARALDAKECRFYPDFYLDVAGTARRCAEIAETVGATHGGKNAGRIAERIRLEFGLDTTPQSETSTAGTPHGNPSSGNLDSCQTSSD